MGDGSSTSRDQVLEQRQAGVVQPDVGGSLGAEARGDAGQSRRQKDNADWCRHRAET
jgi:hypothetical protein